MRASFEFQTYDLPGMAGAALGGVPCRGMNSERALSEHSELLEQACPTKADVPFFNHCMRLARSMGMTWEEGLRYVIEQREGR